MLAKILQGSLPFLIIQTGSVYAQTDGKVLFASWNSSNHASTKWYLPVKAPRAGLVDLDNWGVARSWVTDGWNPRDPAKLEGQYTTVGFLQVDSTGPYESNTNFNDTAIGVDVFHSPRVWSGAVSYGSESNTSDVLWLPAGASFTLGPKANFTTSQLVNINGSQDVQNTTWSSVPFGLSLGSPGANGSVVFGGSYDWTRVNDTQWHQIPPDLGQCLLHIGGVHQGPNGYLNTTCNVDNRVAKVGNSGTTANQSIYLDWFSHEILLPGDPNQAGDTNCQDTVDITFAGARIDVDLGKLIGPRDFGIGCETTGNNITLGLPFLQRLYIYADHDGAVYVARGLASNGTIEPRPFNAGATIEQHVDAKYKGSASRHQLSGALTSLSFIMVGYILS